MNVRRTAHKCAHRLCPNRARPGQALCGPCHAADMKARRVRRTRERQILAENERTCRARAGRLLREGVQKLRNSVITESRKMRAAS